MTEFETLNATVLDAFAPAPATFAYTHMGDVESVDITGVVNTGEDNASVFSLAIRRADFSAKPNKGDLIEVPSGIDGVPAGTYVVASTREEDGSGWMELFFRLQRQG